jgi:hypothetical protein
MAVAVCKMLESCDQELAWDGGAGRSTSRLNEWVGYEAVPSTPDTSSHTIIHAAAAAPAAAGDSLPAERQAAQASCPSGLE